MSIPSSLRTKLIFICSSIMALSMLALTMTNYYYERKQTLSVLHDNMGQLANTSGAAIAEWVRAKQHVVASLKDTLEQPNPMTFLQSAKIAGDFESVYIGQANKQHLSLTPPKPGYDPTARPWYLLASQAGAPVQTMPYADTHSQKLVVTFAEPIRKQDQITAVIGADVSMEQVIRVVNSIHPTPSSYAFLIINKSGCA